jgi:hypothetical protein
MSDKELQKIQDLQFTNIQIANDLLKKFLNANLPFKVTGVQIRPLAVSLNSLNGFLSTESGQRLFFKTHVEPKSIINEYYNSGILAESGYPVIQPVYTSTEWGKQLLIYEWIDEPSLFDIVRGVELSETNDINSLISIQKKADGELLNIYLKTLRHSSASEDKDAPIHQLFSHRLTAGRFSNFYPDKEIYLPGHKIKFEQLSKLKWVINGVHFDDTISDLVQQAIAVLEPGKMDIPTIIGHGDAHNGNIFIDQVNQSLIYFDPAFAGRHSPFLDLAKPLFHNVFAIWMYFPQEIVSTLSVKLDIQDGKVIFDHNFTPSAVRVEFLRSKLQRVLTPLLGELDVRGLLLSNWRKYLKLALFCCPFLTRNLIDPEIFPPEITLLGLAMSIEMGSTSPENNKSFIDSELNLAAYTKQYL